MTTLGDLLHDTALLPDESLATREQAERLQSALRRVRQPYQQVLRLLLNGATVPEVAAARQIGLKSVRTYCSIGLKLLREQLNGRQPRTRPVNTGSKLRPHSQPLAQARNVCLPPTCRGCVRGAMPRLVVRRMTAEERA